MGMYTEVYLNVKLKQDTPKEVLSILSYMVSYEPDKRPKKIPNHPLFESERWYWMLLGDSYYFAADTISILRFNDITEQYFLCIRCNLKNYDNEIENFVDWIDPYIDANLGDFLGFSRYEKSENLNIIRKK